MYMVYEGFIEYNRKRRRKKKEERKFDLSWIIHRFIETLSEEILLRNQN